MGGGVIVSSHGKDYPGKLTCKVLVTCIVAAMGGLIFGYDLGISKQFPNKNTHPAIGSKPKKLAHQHFSKAQQIFKKLFCGEIGTKKSFVAQAFSS
jgi:hypothetical protein